MVAFAGYYEPYLLQTNSSFPLRLSESQRMFNLGQIKLSKFRRKNLKANLPDQPVFCSLINHAFSANQSARYMDTLLLTVIKHGFLTNQSARRALSILLILKRLSSFPSFELCKFFSFPSFDAAFLPSFHPSTPTASPSFPPHPPPYQLPCFLASMFPYLNFCLALECFHSFMLSR